MKKFRIFILLAIFLFSCKENTVNKTDQDGIENSNDEDITSEYEKAEPKDSFFDTEAENHLIFDFKGLINNMTAVEAQKAVSGMGDFTFTFGENELKLQGDMNLYSRTFPENYEQHALAGKEYLMMSIYSMKDNGSLENGNTYYNYDYLSFGTPAEKMLELKESGENITTMPALSWITLYSYYVVLRADKKYFMQYCTLSTAETDQSQFFVDHDANNEFKEGENLLFWGNITMSELIEVSEEDLSSRCVFYSSDGQTLTKDEFDEETAKTGTDFSCEIPEGFFDLEGDHIRFKFRGKINDGSGEYQSGYTEFSVMDLGEKTYHADNYTSGSGLTQVIGQSAVYVQMIGDYELVDNNTAALFNELQFFIIMDELKTMKENDRNTLIFSAENIFNFFSSFLKTKYIEVDGKGYVKSCPVALLDNGSDKSEIYVCLNYDNDFSPGNIFEIAAKIKVTDDETKVGQFYPDGCTCYASAGDEEITCEDFDAMEE